MSSQVRSDDAAAKSLDTARVLENLDSREMNGVYGGWISGGSGTGNGIGGYYPFGSLPGDDELAAAAAMAANGQGQRGNVFYPIFASGF